MPSPTEGMGVDAAAAPVRRTARCDVEPIASLSLGEAMARMTPERVAGATAVIDFLFKSAEPHFVTDVVDVVEMLCRLLLRAGLPLDRYSSSTTMITSQYDAIGRIWRRDEGVEQIFYVSPEAEDPEYLSSPFREAAETRRWVEMWLPETPDSRFGVVATLKAQGLTHYFCIPFWLFNKECGWITFATRQASGFSEQDLLLIASVVPALATRIDGRVGWSTLDKLLRTYVGDEPHTAILAGRAKRGQVSQIEAAMLVADLRDSTGHTANLSTVEAVGLFNDLFDCLVPAIEARRGEVLKYLGDGLLAMFQEIDYAGGACERALDAAEAALEAIQAWNAAHPARRPMQIGAALHVGTIAYGNVGSGSRLDFTVIGRDVALATRIAGLNAKLGQPLLMSAAFAKRMSRAAERIGIYPARGFDEPIEVFRPARGRDGRVSDEALSEA